MRAMGDSGTRTLTRVAGYGVLAVAALTLAYLAAADALVRTRGIRANPDAYRIAPWNGRAAAQSARVSIPPRLDRPLLATLETRATQALREEGLSLDAVVALGTIAQIRGQTPKAREYFGLAERLSRRELQTQFWGIEDAVARNDYQGALRHYDVSLRASDRSREILFPVLTEASADPQIAPALVDILRTKPAWGEPFIYFAAQKSSNPRAMAGLLQQLKRAGVSIPDAAPAMTISTLVGKRAFDEAWTLYLASNPDAKRDRTRDERFAAAPPSPSLFDWQLFQDNGISAAIERGDTGNVLSVSGGSISYGLVARQMGLLPHGSYRFDSKLTLASHSDLSQLYWQISCIDGQVLAKITLPAASTGSEGIFRARVDVPANCPAQYVALYAQPSEGSGGFDGTVEYARLVPGR